MGRPTYPAEKAPTPLRFASTDSHTPRQAMGRLLHPPKKHPRHCASLRSPPPAPPPPRLSLLPPLAFRSHVGRLAIVSPTRADTAGPCHLRPHSSPHWPDCVRVAPPRQRSTPPLSQASASPAHRAHTQHPRVAASPALPNPPAERRPQPRVASGLHTLRAVSPQSRAPATLRRLPPRIPAGYAPSQLEAERACGSPPRSPPPRLPRHPAAALSPQPKVATM